MKKIHIKYNPYNLETEFEIEERPLAQNSKLREKGFKGSVLQEWVEELPQILIDECNDLDFEITFQGTLLDYKDLSVSFSQAQQKNKLKAELFHIVVEEVAQKEARIESIIEQLQQGPFEQLKEARLITTLKQAIKTDFEICIVSTKNADKGTVINSMLNSIKPALSMGNEDSATITRVKYTKQRDLSLKSRSHFVFIDTPVFNDLGDSESIRKIDELLAEAPDSLVVYIMTGALHMNEDRELLKNIIHSLNTGKEEAQKRCIFIIDTYNSEYEEANPSRTLNHVRWYLERYGLKSPTLFLMSALIHTGTTSIEAVIEQHINKYIKIKKIKEAINIVVHAFIKADLLEKTRYELSQIQEEKEQVVKMIEVLKNKSNDELERKQKIEEMFVREIKTIEELPKEIAEGILQKFQELIHDRIDLFRGQKLSLKEIDYEIEKLEKFRDEIEANFKSELQNQINQQVIEIVTNLIEEYQRDFGSLEGDAHLKILKKINIEEVNLKKQKNIGIENRYLIIHEEEIATLNLNEEAYLKLIPFFKRSQVKKALNEKRKTVVYQYVLLHELAQTSLASLEEKIYQTVEEACEYVIQQTKKNLERFSIEFSELDHILKVNLEMETYLLRKQEAEARITELESRLKWLEQLKFEFESVLKI